MRDDVRAHLGDDLTNAMAEIRSTRVIDEINALPPAERERYVAAMAKRARRLQRNLRLQNKQK